MLSDIKTKELADAISKRICIDVLIPEDYFKKDDLGKIEKMSWDKFLELIDKIGNVKNAKKLHMIILNEIHKHRTHGGIIKS